MIWVSTLLLTALCSATETVESLMLEAGYYYEYYTLPLDHLNGDPGLISIKVIMKGGNPDGPLFVYTGNESPIEDFFLMTGWLVYTLGPYYDATVAFIEHRYYGYSVPSPLNFAYLNTDQVLLDFANIVMKLKPKETTPVVAFGGSYGGMLSAYFRIKFPFLVDGAIASSGPVIEYLDTEGLGLYHTVTQSYFDSNPSCAFNIDDGYNVLDNFIQNDYTWPALSSLFKTCTEITQQSEVVAIEDWITNALETFAQLNYPYPTKFAGYIPAYPVETSCSVIDVANTGNRNMWKTLRGLAEVSFMFYNNSGTETCFNPWSTKVDPVLYTWTYQKCSELVMPQGMYGIPNDMFSTRPFDLSSWDSYCKATYGVTPNVDWYPLNYGFTWDYKEGLKNLTNVVFSYGTIDPWQSGCIKESPNDNVLVIGIKGAAHHLDLRRPSPNDPMTVIFARQQEQKKINQWISWG